MKDITRTDILIGVIEIIADHGYEKVQIGEDSRLIEDLNMDSLEFIELETNLEKKFNVPVNITEKNIPHTVRDIVNHIEKKLA